METERSTFLKDKVKVFGTDGLAPRFGDSGLQDYKVQKEMKDSIKGQNQFFDNDMTSQLEASLITGIQGSSQNRRGITWNIPRLEVVYRSSPYAQRAIQWRASTLLIKGIDLNTQDKNFTSNQLGVIQQHVSNTYYEPLVNMFRWGFLYGGSGAIKVVKGRTGESDFAKPFDPDSVKKGEFLGLKPLARWYQIEPALDKGLVSQVDPEQGIYNASEIGKPIFYRVNFSGGLSGYSGLNEKDLQANNLMKQGKQILVHRSWLYIFNPFPLGHIETQIERYWSKSIIEVASLDLERHGIIWSATAKSAVKNNLGVLNIQGLDATLRNEYTNKVVNSKLDLIKYTTSHGIVALGEKDTFTFAESSLAGNEKAIEQSIKEISSAFGTPANYLFSDPNFYDEANYLQCLNGQEDTQKNDVYAMLYDLVKILAKHLYGKKIEDFSFDFKSILTLTPAQKADVMGKMVTVLKEAHEAGFIDTLTGIQALPDILNNPSNVFSHLNEKYLERIKQGDENGDPITATWFKIELAKALNQFQNKEGQGLSGVESPESSTARVKKGGDPTKQDKLIKRNTLNPDKGKE